MLIAAREHLESGKEYRSVRAGAGLHPQGDAGDRAGRPRRQAPRPADRDAHRHRSPAWRSSALSSSSARLVYPRPPASRARGTVDDLLRVRGELMNETAVARFDSRRHRHPRRLAAASAGCRWTPQRAAPGRRHPGTEPGHRPRPAAGSSRPSPIGRRRAVRRRSVLCASASRATTRSSSSSSPPTPTSAPTAPPAPTIWSGSSRAAAEGPAQRPGAGQCPAPSRPDGLRRPAPTAARPRFPVRILMNHDSAIVECDGQRLWAGPHGLPAAPRYVGVRFLRTGPKGPRPGRGAGIRVMKK